MAVTPPAVVRAAAAAATAAAAALAHAMAAATRLPWPRPRLPQQLPWRMKQLQPRLRPQLPGRGSNGRRSHGSCCGCESSYSGACNGAAAMAHPTAAGATVTAAAVARAAHTAAAAVAVTAAAVARAIATAAIATAQLLWRTHRPLPWLRQQLLWRVSRPLPWLRQQPCRGGRGSGGSLWCVQHNGRCRNCDNRCRGACNPSNVRCRACGSSCCDACNGCSTLQRLLPWLWEQLLRRACNSLAAAAAVTTQLPWRMQRPLPWLPWRMHTAPGDINRAQHMRAGLRGAYRCITWLFRGHIGPPGLLRTVQRDESH